MPGLAQHHFPQVVWRENEKRLWNPIHKKALKNRPEERVRLRIIEALIDAGWSKHRISTEEALRPKDQTQRRTDIICYDQNFEPRILIECKAESVPISEKVAEQTARYNRSVNAPYLLMSNGINDFWYRTSEQNKPERLEEPPEILEIPSRHPEREFHYWEERGFAGKNTTDSGLRQWLTTMLNAIWRAESGQGQFIEFNNSPTDLPLAHYFRIFNVNSDHRMALGLHGTPFGGTRLVAVLNRNKLNVGLIEVNLDLLAEETSPNATIYSESDPQNFDIRDYVSLNLQEVPAREKIIQLPASLDELFDDITV